MGEAEAEAATLVTTKSGTIVQTKSLKGSGICESNSRLGEVLAEFTPELLAKITLSILDRDSGKVLGTETVVANAADKINCWKIKCCLQKILKLNFSAEKLQYLGIRASNHFRVKPRKPTSPRGLFDLSSDDDSDGADEALQIDLLANSIGNSSDHSKKAGEGLLLRDVPRLCGSYKYLHKCGGACDRSYGHLDLVVDIVDLTLCFSCSGESLHGTITLSVPAYWTVKQLARALVGPRNAIGGQNCLKKHFFANKSLIRQATGEKEAEKSGPQSSLTGLVNKEPWEKFVGLENCINLYFVKDGKPVGKPLEEHLSIPGNNTTLAAVISLKKVVVRVPVHRLPKSGLADTIEVMVPVSHDLSKEKLNKKNLKANVKSMLETSGDWSKLVEAATGLKSADDVPFQPQLNMDPEAGFEIVIKQPNGLYVKTLTGKQFECEFSPGTTILELKHTVQELEGIPPDQQRIIFGGRQLEDHRTCAHHGLTRGCIVHLVVSLWSWHSSSPQTILVVAFTITT